MKKVLSFLIVALIGVVVGVAGFYFFNLNQEEIASRLIPGPIKYNCEFSGGTFEDGACVCPIEEQIGQTQGMMYDQATGYCQTTYGGPGGDAFWGEMGMPWGRHAFYTGIVTYWCEETGGSNLGGVCECSDGDTYNETTGRCE